MRVTRRQLRSLIRESLLRENAELKKLKKLFVSGAERHEQAWELADTLGLAGQVEAMMRTDFRFLKKDDQIGPEYHYRRARGLHQTHRIPTCSLG